MNPCLGGTAMRWLKSSTLTRFIASVSLSHAQRYVLLTVLHIKLLSFLLENLFLKFEYKCQIQNCLSALGKSSCMEGKPYQI